MLRYWLLLLCILNVRGDTTIVQLSTGTLHIATIQYVGQSFATPATGGPWNRIRFNFVANGSPYAIGTAFLLSQRLPNGTGGDTVTITPATLDASAPGFIASSTGVSNGQYVFDPSVTLQAGTVYYLYETSPIPAQTISGGADLVGPGKCCISYFAGSASSGYVPTFDSANFTVTGLAVGISTTPAPPSVYLAVAGLLLIVRWQAQQIRASG